MDDLANWRVGAIVDYVEADGVHCAAIVVSLGTGVTIGECELQVAVPGFGWRRVPKASYNPHQKMPGTWHWPEVRERGTNAPFYDPTTERK